MKEPQRYPCTEPGCDRTFDTPHGVIMHKGRSHKKPKPEVAHVDDLFDRIGAATDALFPGGVPTSRIIEIAALQREMLKVVNR